MSLLLPIDGLSRNLAHAHQNGGDSTNLLSPFVSKSRFSSNYELPIEWQCDGGGKLLSFALLC